MYKVSGEEVLVIGGSGLLGSKLTDVFTDAHFTFNKTEIKTKRAYRLDLTDGSSLRLILGKLRPRTIIVTAAMTNVDGCELNPDIAYAVNSSPFVTITNYLKERRGRLIQISTDYVFSGEKGNYREEDERNPVNVYGRSKMKAEEIIITSGVDYSIIRTSGIFGMGQSTGKTNFFRWLYDSLSKGQTISLVSDQFYSPTLNFVLANAIGEVYEREITGVLNFSSRDRINRHDFGILVADIFQKKRELIKTVTMREMKWIAKRPRDSSLDNAKAANLLVNKPIDVEHEVLLAKKEILR